jgi:hypothetical protein
LQECSTLPVAQFPALSAWQVPASAVVQHRCVVVSHLAEPQVTEPGSGAAPPSGTPVVEPLLLPVPPSPPLLAPPSPLPPLDPPLLVEPLLVPPPSSPPELPPPPPSSVALPLLPPPPLLDPKPLLLPCPASLPGEPLVLLPLQCASTTGAAARARTQKAIVV